MGASILIASAMALPSVAAMHHGWPIDPNLLVGERPPPNPFPPRT
jgi:hypothetical protein